MGRLAVTSEELLSKGAMLQQGGVQVKSELDNMRRQLEPLHASWEGAASGGFQQLWTEWETSAKQLNEALEGISRLLNQAGTTYQEAEDSIKRSMS